MPLPLRWSLTWLAAGIMVGTVSTQAVSYLLSETRTPELAASEIQTLMTQPRYEITAEPPRENPVLEKTAAAENAPTTADASRAIASQSPSDKLPAPARLIPAKLADLRKKTRLTLRWDSVDGAGSYQVKVWQFHDHKQVILSDKSVSSTRAEIEPQYAGEIHWQVTAVSKSGEPGEPSAPITLDVIH